MITYIISYVIENEILKSNFMRKLRLETLNNFLNFIPRVTWPN